MASTAPIIPIRSPSLEARRNIERAQQLTSQHRAILMVVIEAIEEGLKIEGHQVEALYACYEIAGLAGDALETAYGQLR